MSENKSETLRAIFRLKKEPCLMQNLKPGEFFVMSDSDDIKLIPSEIYLCSSDPKPYGDIPGKFECMAHTYVYTKFEQNQDETEKKDE